jgi:hypothetical protein
MRAGRVDGEAVERLHSRLRRMQYVLKKLGWASRIDTVGVFAAGFNDAKDAKQLGTNHTVSTRNVAQYQDQACPLTPIGSLMKRKLVITEEYQTACEAMIEYVCCACLSLCVCCHSIGLCHYMLNTPRLFKRCNIATVVSQEQSVREARAYDQRNRAVRLSSTRRRTCTLAQWG